MLKIPYGISNFKRIKEENYFYVDKTEYIEILESYGEPYILFLRPRRFGKSLFLSTLEHYYDTRGEDTFDLLFGDLYIGSQRTRLAHHYYILKFDFSGIWTSTEETLLEGFSHIVNEGIHNFLKKYNLAVDIKPSEQPAIILSDFLNKVKYEIDGTIYLLIDEYDHFANELLGFHRTMFDETFRSTGFVRKWYETIKKKTDDVISRIFITGVSPITLDSMTSGFNIASNLTREPELNEMMGFRLQDISPFVRMMNNDKREEEEMIDRLKEYYDGYLFSTEGQERVFNSEMILYFFKHYSRRGKEPESLIDTNIASDYHKIEQLFSLKNKEKNDKILESILEDEPQEVVFTREFNFLSGFSNDDFKSLLFYLGFLTIDHSDTINVKLKVPNYVIKEIYFDFFREVINKRMESTFDLSYFRKIISDLAIKGNISPFVSHVESMLKSLSKRDFMSFDEKYIKIIMLTHLVLSRFYRVKSEYEVEDGYIDIALLKREGQPVEYEALIELKYIKKSDYIRRGETIVQERLHHAKEQLLNYGSTEEFKDKKGLKKWIIIFAGYEAVIIEEM